MTTTPIRFPGINGLPIAISEGNKSSKATLHLPSFNSVKKTWEYSYEVIGLISNLMSIITESCALTCKWLSKKSKILMNKTILYIDLLSAVGLPEKIASISSRIKNIWNSFHYKDHEGAILATLSFGWFMGNMFDTVTSLVNTSLEVLNFKRVKWISSIGLPLALSLIGLDFGLDCKSLHQRVKFQKEFKKELIDNIKEENTSSEKLHNVVVSFLDKHLGTFNNLEAKEQILERSTSEKIVFEFKKLKDLINEKHSLSNQEQRIVTQIKVLEHTIDDGVLVKKISMLSSIIGGIGVSLFLSPAASIAPYVLFMVSTSIGLGLKIKDDLE